MADTAPKPDTSRPKLTARPPREKPKQSQQRKRSPGRSSRKDRIQDFVNSIALGVSVFDAQDGFLIMESSEQIAESWANLASQNSQVAQYIDRALTGGAWGGVIMVHGSLAVKILQNHDVIPELTFSVPGPENNGGQVVDEPSP